MAIKQRYSLDGKVAVATDGAGILGHRCAAGLAAFGAAVAVVDLLECTVHASRIPALLEKRLFYHDRTVDYEVPKWKSPGGDDMIDVLLVEAIIKHRGMAANAR